MTSTASSSRDALPPGTRLMDYDVEGLLGAGGFGLVYRARDEALHRTVAIKEYLPTALAMRGDDGGVVLRSPAHAEPFALGLKSFVNEARLLARFDHPSLVKVFRFWEARGTAYMVMPCYEGPTLYDARRQMDGPPEEAWLRALMDPLLGALDCLHREQVFHRDVAPDNILVLQDPDAPCGIRPVLLDFGAARRVINENTQALTAILKPSFAPIEQYAETTQLRQGPWTDLYGLAAVLHYCITGRTPVPATARAVHDDLQRLADMAEGLRQDFRREYDPSLLATIDRALSVRPDQRPASAGAWREFLARGPRAEAWTAPDTAPRASDSRPAADVVPRTVAAAANKGRAGAQGPASASPHAPGSPGGEALPATWPVGGRDDVPVTGPAEWLEGARPWPRALVWSLGGVGLAAVVALSAWTMQRAPAPGAGAGAAALDAAHGEAPRSPAAPARSGPPPAALALPGAGTGAARAAAMADPAKDGAVPGERVPHAATPAPSAVRVSRASAERSAPSRGYSGPLNPRQACGGRVFIALAICMKRHCSRPAYSQHGECSRMREQEAAQQQLSHHGYP